MKVENNGSAHETAATSRPETPRTGPPEGRGRSAVVAGADRVALSAAGSLVSQAMRRAEEAPEIRQQLVDRLRQKLAEGKVGNDSERLADRVIDSLLGG